MKEAVEDLAFVGGTPAFTEALHVGRPNIGNRTHFIERVHTILDSRWLSNDGHFVQEFEQRIAEFLQVRNCIAVCNATLGLGIAARALELDGEVLVPSFTFIGTAHAFQWLGLTPIFCDISSTAHNIDPERVEEQITSHTTGIVGVHLWGMACAIEELTAIAQKHHLRLLFDAAHAFGCSYRGQMIGNFGDAEVFSFHATKFFNTFEGGAIVTNNDELAQKIRLMKNFGFAGDMVFLGTNGKMSEISAAMGLTGLESLDDLISVNRRNYRQYQQELKKLPGIRLVAYDEAERCNYQYIVLEIDETVTQITPDHIMKILWAENVLARRYFSPGCHCMEPYRSHFPDAKSLLPETEKVAQKTLVLPTGTAIGKEAISQICQLLRFIVGHGAQITEMMSRQATL